MLQDHELLLSAVGCQPTAPKCLKYPPNPRVSRPWLLLSAVGCQPTAPKCLKYPPNPECFKTMVAFKCCRLPTYSPKMQSSSLQHQYFNPPGWLPLSAVGCQPTAPKCLNYPWNPECFKTMVAFKCCRLPTYSPKMPQVPSKPSCFRELEAFWGCRLQPTALRSAVGCQPTAPKCLKYPPTLVFQDHGCF